MPRPGVILHSVSGLCGTHLLQLNSPIHDNHAFMLFERSLNFRHFSRLTRSLQIASLYDIMGKCIVWFIPPGVNRRPPPGCLIPSSSWPLYRTFCFCKSSLSIPFATVVKLEALDLADFASGPAPIPAGCSKPDRCFLYTSWSCTIDQPGLAGGVI